MIKTNYWFFDDDTSAGHTLNYVLDFLDKRSVHFVQTFTAFKACEKERKIALGINFLKQSTKDSSDAMAEAFLSFKKYYLSLIELSAIGLTVKPHSRLITNYHVADRSEI